MTSHLRFSAIAARIRPSPIRELFKVISQPGMISFAGGYPDPAIFPVPELASTADVLSRDGSGVLQYGASEGYKPLVDVVIAMMRAQLGRDVAADEIVITTGSQQAANLVARALLDPGDVVVVEAPTYPGTLHTFRNVGARFATVPCDGDGMEVDRLRDVVARAEKETGRRPKLIYSIPDFSNPSGACLSLARRRRLVELADELEVPIFEDDPYGRLRYGGESLPTLKSLSTRPETVLYASSFSKVLAPGLRVAWAAGDPRLVRTMVLLRQGEDLCTSTVAQALVAEYCRRGHLEQHLERIIDHYRRKRDAMQASLSREIDRSSATWHEPQGGFFFWLRLERRLAADTFARAIEQKVAFLPGPAFYPPLEDQVGEPSSGDRHARLCFTFADPEQIARGCERLRLALV